MSLFDTLFPKQFRSAPAHRPQTRDRRLRVPARRNRLLELGPGEQLERRDLLAVSVVQETPTTFFTDFSRSFDSEYATYTVTNGEATPIDAWVKVTFPAGSLVGCGPGYNNEDGLYHIGTLTPSGTGASGEAFLYYTAKSNTAVAQPYSLEVWNGKPDVVGSQKLTVNTTPAALAYTSIVNTIAAEPNKVNTVTISPSTPSVGDVLTMQVDGYLGNGANRVLFAPANRADWQPDVFELRTVTHKISGTTKLPENRLFYDGLLTTSDQKPFTSVYQFLITGPVTTPTPVSPTQWTQDGQQSWKHHKPDAAPFPPIAPVTYELSISKTDGTATYKPGTTTTYTVTLQNTGKAAVSNVLVTDVLPPQIDPTSTWTVTYSGGASSGSPGGLGNGGTGNISGTVNLAALTGTVTITINAKILPTASGAMTNEVDATTPDGTTISAIDTNLDVNLSLKKDDGKTTYTPGGTTTYTIVLQNTGEARLDGVTLDDTLPVQVDPTSTWTAVYSGGASSGPAPNGLGNSGTGSFLGRTVNLGGKGGTVTITINAKILSSATGQMTNTIYATLPTGGPPLSASDTNAPVPDERLTLTKDNGQTTYVPGTTTTYTIKLSNIGLSDVGGLLVSDVLPVQLDPATTTWFATYTDASGTLPTAPTTGDILGTVTTLKGSTGVVTITINGVILSTATDDMVNTVDVTNSVSLSATDRDTATPTVGLTVTKSDGTGTYVPGSPTTYTITINNAGPSFLNDGTISDSLLPPATGGTWTVFSSSGVGTLVTPNAGSGNISANLDLAAGGQVVIKYTVDTDSTATGPLVNTVVVTPPAGTSGGSTSATDTDTATPTADLVVTKTRTSAPPVAGQAVTYQITVANNGPSSISTFTGVDTTTPLLLTPSYSVSTGTYDEVTGVWTAFFGDTFDPGEVVTFTLTGTVPATSTGLLINTATAKPPEGVVDPKPENNTSTVTDTIAVLPVLTITKTDGKDSYVPGTSTTYTIVATNLGPSFLANGTVTDPLPAQVATASWTAVYTGIGSTGPAAGTGGLDETVSLAVGGTATFTFTVQIKPEATGDLVNTATIAPPPTSQGTPATATDTNTQASPQVSLSVTKDDGSDRYTPGTSTTYTIVVTNAGPSFLKGGIVKDLLPSPQGASASWTATTTGVGSSVTPASGGNDINATVDLPVKGTATFLYTVNIKADATGQMDNTVTVSPPPGTTGNTATATDSDFGPEPPLSVFGGLVVGSDDGCNGPPFVRVLDPNDGTTLVEFLAYESTFRGSVRVATGDVNGDGVEEILVAPGRNRIGEIRVFTQQGVLLSDYTTFPFGKTWRGGVEVTAADFNGDGVKDIVAGMSSAAGFVSGFVVTPNALDPVADTPAFSFRGFPPRYAGGVMLAAGDFGTFSGGTSSSLPDGRDEIVVGSNSGRRATANVWAVSSAPRIVRTILPFGTKFTGGVTLSTAKYDSDSIPDVFIGAGIGGKSVVEIYSGATGQKITTLPPAAFGSFSKPNAAVFTAALDLTGDGPATNVYGVQGRNGGRGTNGVSGFTRSSAVTAILPKSTGNLPPLRIAPLKVRLLG